MKATTRRLFLLLIPVIVAGAFWATPSAEAATIVVNSRVDDPYDSACSVREAAETLFQRADYGGCVRTGDLEAEDEIVVEFASACASSIPGLCESGQTFAFTSVSYGGVGIATAQTGDTVAAPFEGSFEPPWRVITGILTAVTLVPPEAREGALLEALYLIDQLLGPPILLNNVAPPLAGFSGLGDLLSD